jgi:hypothetical protein
MAYILGFSSKPYKDPKPPPAPQSSSLNQLVSARETPLP